MMAHGVESLRQHTGNWVENQHGSKCRTVWKLNMQQTCFEYLRAHDGLRLRYGYWRSGRTVSRGTVVVLGGRSEFIEKYLETIHDLLHRGFDAVSMDWRGQGLSGRLLVDGTKGYVKTYDDYASDLEGFVEKIVVEKCRRPIIVMAHSMGANIVWQLLHRSGRLFDKAVMTAPMVDIQTHPIPNGFARWWSQVFVKMGMGTAVIPSFKPNDSYCQPFEKNGLTHDPVRFHRIQKMLEENSQLSAAAITFGWLAATFDAIDRLDEPGFFSNIITPQLIVVAGQDRVVSNDALRYVAYQMPSCRVVTVDGAYHEILQERDVLRDQFWQAFEQFF
jgi:lysophospholipase